MIPLTLHIKNFLSYGPELQTINFAPYPLICLSGKNGHGKSALLDAITWTVWGQARKTGNAAKADLGLLRLGQTQMMSSLDFECNGQTYRIRREFAVTYGKPYAALDFGILDPSTDQVTSLTDKTIRATQEKIISVVGLDFDSFVNSAFLRQGHSNEFSKKSPKERKEILADIIGLNRFDVLRKRAMDKAKEAVQEHELVRTMQQRILQELEQSQTITSQLALLQESLLRISEQETALQKNNSSLLQKKSALAQQQHEAELARFKYATKKQEYETLHEKLQKLRNFWKEVHRQRLQLRDQHQLEEDKKKLKAAVKRYQELLQKHLVLKEALLKSKEAEQLVAQKLHTEHTAELQSKKMAVERLEHQVSLEQSKEKDVAQQLNEINEEINRLKLESASYKKDDTNEFQKILAQEERIFEKRKNYYQRYITQGNMIKGDATGILHKQQLAHDDDNPSCPVCEQNLSASRKRFLKAKFSKQERFFAHRLQRLSSLISRLKSLLVEQHTKINDLRKKIEESQQARQKINHLEESLKKLDAQRNAFEVQQKHVKDRLALLTKDLQTAQDAHKNSSAVDIAKDAQYVELQKKSLQLTQESESLGYDPQEHEKVQQELTVIEGRSISFEQLEQKRAQQKHWAEQIHEIILSLKKVTSEKSSLEKESRQYDQLNAQEKEIHAKEQLLTKKIKECTQEKERILQDKGSLENQRQKLTHLEKEMAELKKRGAVLLDLAEEYQTISIALGKEGIQALLIEDTIPEIEQEANQLLAKLTDNQAHILIESLRDLKKGGTKETLDIKISDPIGIRPYELFSGGEAFRIDFALRIAISKLLARRAGTSLQTLIIDEGFGSQDEDGLNHIMDALYKIQDDFAKIIIVSHLPSMKDQFPIHFFIEKGAQGSKIQIMEQG
jgi:exonuclease SbcC